MVKEIYKNNTKQITLNVSNSKIEALRQKDITKTGVRVYKDGYIGVSGAIGSYDEDKLFKEAEENLNQRVEYDCSPSENICQAIDNSSEIIKEKEFIGEFQEVLEHLRKVHGDFIFSNKIRMTETVDTLVNDMNLNLEYKDKGFVSELLFKEKSSSSIFDGILVYEGRKYDRKRFCDEADMILEAYKNRVELPHKKSCPLIFNSTSNGILLKFITDLNGKQFGTGSSLFSNKIGQRVFNRDFTFYQSLNPKDVYNIPFFDAEGAVNKDYRYALIEDGVIKAPYTDKRTSRKFNLIHTGSAQAEYDSVPDTGFLGYKIKESNKSIKELLNGEPGIFISIADGGDFTPDGSYATPVQLAFLFDGERLIGRLPEFQISSDVFKMFGDSFRGAANNNPFPLSEDKLTVIDFNIE